MKPMTKIVMDSAGELWETPTPTMKTAVLFNYAYIYHIMLYIDIGKNNPYLIILHVLASNMYSNIVHGERSQLQSEAF